MRYFFILFFALLATPSLSLANDCAKQPDDSIAERFHCIKVLNGKSMDKVTYKIVAADLCISKSKEDAAIEIAGVLKMRNQRPMRGNSRIKTYNIFHHVNRFSGSKKAENGYYMEYDERIFINNIIGDIIYEESRFNATYNRINGNLDIEEYETQNFNLKYSIAATLGCKQYQP